MKDAKNFICIQNIPMYLTKGKVYTLKYEDRHYYIKKTDCQSDLDTLFKNCISEHSLGEYFKQVIDLSKNIKIL